MMKNIWIVTLVAVTGMLISCNGVRREPGRAYMPDMAYSRAYETYASTQNLKDQGVNYSALPVNGTFAKNDLLFHYPFKNDSAGYANSATVKNPLPAMDAVQYLEAARLYLVNCGICHGTKLDGNGPLWNGGSGPFPAAPKNLLSPDLVKMADGTMYHSITYGKNSMGGYASQLNVSQRWMVIQYIRDKQANSGAAAADTTSKGMVPMAMDTTKKK